MLYRPSGESVIAIGNPGDAMLFSVTKGIVSAVGTFPSAGPGTGFRPYTPINPVTAAAAAHSRGEVIGINTQKLIKKMLLASALPSVHRSARSPPPLLSNNSVPFIVKTSSAAPGSPTPTES